MVVVFSVVVEVVEVVGAVMYAAEDVRTGPVATEAMSRWRCARLYAVQLSTSSCHWFVGSAAEWRESAPATERDASIAEDPSCCTMFESKLFDTA